LDFITGFSGNIVDYIEILLIHIRAFGRCG